MSYTIFTVDQIPFWNATEHKLMWPSVESLHEFFFFGLKNTISCFKYLLNCFKKLVAEKTVAYKFYLDILSTDTTISSSQMLYCFEFVWKKSISSKKKFARKYYHLYDKVHLSTNPVIFQNESGISGWIPTVRVLKLWLNIKF